MYPVMKVLVILSHPDKGSFNHAVAGTVIQALQACGHEVVAHDLYAEKFDALLPLEEIPRGAKVDPVVERHCEELTSADGIVVIHPNWWGQPPAILKGWVDRVVRPGVAYRFVEGDSGEGVPVGLLKARTALVLNTSNTGEERERTAFGDPLELIWKNCIFGLCGVENFHRRTFGIVVTSTPEQRSQWLEEAGEITRRLFPPG